MPPPKPALHASAPVTDLMERFQQVRGLTDSQIEKGRLPVELVANVPAAFTPESRSDSIAISQSRTLPAEAINACIERRIRFHELSG